MSAVFGKCLLIDNNALFIEELHKSEELLQEFPLQIQRSLEEGLKYYKKNQSTTRAVIFSGHLFSSADLLQQTLSNYSEVPVLFISHFYLDPRLIDPQKEIVISQPKNYQDIVNVLKDKVFVKPNWEEYEESHDEKFVEIILRDKDFVPIKISEFHFAPKSQFNIFIKLGKDKYVKVINAGEENQKDIIDKYTTKGFSQLHLPLNEHGKYLAYYESLTRKVTTMPVNNSVKVQAVLRLGNQVVQNLLQTGLQPDKLDMAESFLNQSVMLIKSMHLREGNLKKFIADIEKNEHSAAISFLSGIIANEVGFESLKSVKLVGIAALVHDIGLHDLDPEADESLMFNDYGNELFTKHAKHGADMLRRTGLFDEVICLAVEQHHQRRRGNENSARNSNMNLVAEIVGVADAFYNLVIKGSYNPYKLDLFLNGDLKNFSHTIEKSLLKILDQQRRKTG